MTAGIEARGLWKNYNGFTAVKNLTFTVEPGEVLGIVGPNGAGKTTTLKMVIGLVQPSHGEIRIGGLDVLRNAMQVKRMIGFLPEDSPLYDNMRVHQYLHFFADLFDVPREEASMRIDELLSNLDLEAGDRRLGELSKGMRRKVAIARSLINDPTIIVYDEPASGLDPMTRHKVIEFIRDMKGEKTTIFSAHDLAQVEAVCDRVLLMRRGETVAMGTMDELRDIYGETEYVVEYECNGGRRRSRTGSMSEVNHIATEIAKDGGCITNIRTETSSLEDVFLRIMREE